MANDIFFEVTGAEKSPKWRENEICRYKYIFKEKTP